MATPSSTPPISFTRLKQIATDACQSALGSADYYEHTKTEAWNTAIINSILRSLISESSPTGGTPSYKYAVNSTIIQHLVPTAALNKAKAIQESSIPKTEESGANISTSDKPTNPTGTDGKPHVGRRGMHSATGAYWNEKTDGMWSFKYEGATASLARTSHHFFGLCSLILGPESLSVSSNQSQTISPPVTRPTPTMASVSFATASSTSSINADYDTLNSTDTDMSSSPEEEEWELKITPDMIQRLFRLPENKSGATLITLPTELQLEIFSYLDKIDSTCLGLASPRTYEVYRAIHGTKMPLNTRRVGPNLLEAAWELVGRQECQHCGVYRCELHQHIKSWMPKELEYCSMKLNFGIPAGEGANLTCYRGKPSKPRRCGRHPLRTTSMHQDDGQKSKL
ncbi:hypothetical protein G7Y89_g13743 [Cudoniella acicularis]|uniref:F-box domain-containing protein n=1 Tax=Cudoniella acicularis TaxID=354080 RepID=A0A8H4R8Y4_9HELO|nr:hypothetical protein G7Y89_g13743 [Cudoniella acicularis]